ncbi:RHS repeat-associated core domain-containing protein [Tenacibaculum maritimum]|uniref:RHS repeat domain-containing protein n=1 Tax=Tenacibaculum maritimum TaxID=107401 RepID=UPI00293E3B29|nr:RHS repeat-associated core domain-containing protein [Tenacibaculum maritimum]
MGTPTQMYDEEGEQVWERSLDLNGKVINGSNAPCPFLYQGQYYDKEIELAYNRFRYYDPDDGRYISKDPIGLLSGEYGFYNYVGDSNSWVDPFGLDFMDMVASSIQRTGRKFQGAEIYKFIKKAKGDSFNFKKGDYFYLDNLHKDHFETFSKNDSSKGVYNLDGSKNVDKTKKASNRKGPSCG